MTSASPKFQVDQVSIHDRGLAYGDGVFETIAVRHHAALNLSAHTRRLHEGCVALGIPPPDASALRDAINQRVATHADDERGVLKVLVTRGEGGRGYQAPITANPNVLLEMFPWPATVDAIRQDGAVVGIGPALVSAEPICPRSKHLNRLPQVLAANTLQGRPECHELLIRNSLGAIVEGSRCNLFVECNGVVFTPAATAVSVSGVTRSAAILLLREMGHTVREFPLSHDLLARADSVFLTNSVIGVWPVRALRDLPGGERTAISMDIGRRLLSIMLERNLAA